MNLIKSHNDLSEYFLFCNRQNSSRKDNLLERGVYVTSKIRREVLTSEDQGKITIGGRMNKFVFSDMGGGVWKCTIAPFF